MAFVHVNVGKVTGIDLDYFQTAKAIYLRVYLVPTGTFQKTKSIKKHRTFDFREQTLTFEVTKEDYAALSLEFNLVAKCKPDHLVIARFPMKLSACPQGFRIRGDFRFIPSSYYPEPVSAPIQMHVALARKIGAFSDQKKEVNIKAIQDAALEREAPQRRSH